MLGPLECTVYLRSGGAGAYLLRYVIAGLGVRRRFVFPTRIVVLVRKVVHAARRAHDQVHKHHTRHPREPGFHAYNLHDRHIRTHTTPHLLPGHISRTAKSLLATPDLQGSSQVVFFFFPEAEWACESGEVGGISSRIGVGGIGP